MSCIRSVRAQSIDIHLFSTKPANITAVRFFFFFLNILEPWHLDYVDKFLHFFNLQCFILLQSFFRILQGSIQLFVLQIGKASKLLRV